MIYSVGLLGLGSVFEPPLTFNSVVIDDVMMTMKLLYYDEGK